MRNQVALVVGVCGTPLPTLLSLSSASVLTGCNRLAIAAARQEWSGDDARRAAAATVTRASVGVTWVDGAAADADAAVDDVDDDAAAAAAATAATAAAMR